MNPELKRIRDDASRLYELARRVANCVKRPPTLDPEDVVQDAVVALIEVIDSPDPLPVNYPPHLALILRARRQLGGRSAYRDEWNWSNRRYPFGPDLEPPASRPLTEPDPADLVDDLVAAVPPPLRPVARLMFARDPDESPNTLWERSGLTRRRFYATAKAVLRKLRDVGLWDDTCNVAHGQPWKL